jgi:methyltransferase (TIGR00027 family)|nr:SAM-dependent methyltransferase [Kofleriaceae bacterium]
MRAGKASFTAAAVSAARGIAGVDPLAGQLVDGALGALVRFAQRPAARAIVNAAALGLIDHAELRTRAIDAAVRDAVAAGARQLVVLGAGLDARAWRMTELADVDVLEVDHASTQTFKRERVATWSPRARSVRFAAIDFERDSLDDVLARAGHDATAPTIWVWEGVTPYIARAATQATLAVVAQRSAPGSRLAVTYATPSASAAGPAFVRVAKLGFRAIGEELRGLISSDDMRDELVIAGLDVVADSGSGQWAKRYGDGRRRLLLVDERLAVAERRR